MADVMASGELGEPRTQHQGRQPGGSPAAGARGLNELHALLDRGWFCDRHSVRFELEMIADRPVLLLVRPGRQLIANWTARGDTLVFTMANGTEVRAETLDCAVSITCDFLDQAKARRN